MGHILQTGMSNEDDTTNISLCNFINGGLSKYLVSISDSWRDFSPRRIQGIPGRCRWKFHPGSFAVVAHAETIGQPCRSHGFLRMHCEMDSSAILLHAGAGRSEFPDSEDTLEQLRKASNRQRWFDDVVDSKDTAADAFLQYQDLFQRSHCERRPR